MKTNAFITGTLLLVVGLLHAQDKDEEKSSLSWRIMSEVETSYGTSDSDLQKTEFIVDPEMTWKINKNLKIFAQLRYYSELTDNLEPGRNTVSNYARWSKPIILNDKSQLELRELYIDAKLGKSYWRIGKQQIVWGQTEGVKVLDVINPMTWREFILDDFDDSRIPLWSLKTDFGVGTFKFQGIWIPDLTYHQFPAAGGTFARQQEMPQVPEGILLQVNELDKPSRPLHDSDLGVRVSTFLKGWDLSLSYLYHYDDIPVVGRGLSVTSDGPLLIISPTYLRSSMFGLTFGNTLGNFGIRGEVGITPDKPFTTLNQSDADGIYQSDQYVSGIGVDYFGINQTLITVQWFGDALLSSDLESYMPRDKMLNYVTLMVTRGFFNQKLEAKIFSAYGFNLNDALVDIKTSYLVTDNLKMTLTGDLFFGKKSGIVGQFNTNDRIMLGVEYGLQPKK